MVDAGAVTGKYIRFFDRIQSNKSISEVISFEKILSNMLEADEVPEELETRYLLARKYLDSGKKALHEWRSCIGDINEKLEASIEQDSLYDALKGLQLLQAIPYIKIFNDNGYIMDDTSKDLVKQLSDELRNQVDTLIVPYVSSMYCKSVEGVNTFRNHNTKCKQCLKNWDFRHMLKKLRNARKKNLTT